MKQLAGKALGASGRALRRAGGLFSVGTIAKVGLPFAAIFATLVIARVQENDSDRRTYAELMSKREDADNQLRKDMFASILQTFIDPQTVGQPDAEVLRLELLAYNFHESIDLKPLFEHVERELVASRKLPDSTRQALLRRLDTVSRDVVSKEAGILARIGTEWDVSFEMQGGVDGGGFDSTITSRGRRGRTQYMDLSFGYPDTVRRKLPVRLALRDSAGEQALLERSFQLSYFDFPMIDNIRLDRDERIALVLNRFERAEEDTGSFLFDVSVLRFPGKYAGFRDKRFYDELREDLKMRGWMSWLGL